MFSIQATLAQAHTARALSLLSPACAAGVSIDLLRAATTILGVTLTLLLCALIKRELRRYLRKIHA